jgi:hypothetical protein
MKLTDLWQSRISVGIDNLMLLTVQPNLRPHRKGEETEFCRPLRVETR